jgi:molybdopterin synthase sulfur carrier subunit
MIEISLLSPFREVVGKKELTIDLESIQDKSILGVLTKLCTDYPKLKSNIFDAEGNVVDYISIFLNDKPVISTEGLQQKLKRGDKLLLFPPVAGG